MERGKLYLIPSLISDIEISKSIPQYNVEIINSIDIFIVEEIKTARKFLKKCNYPQSFDNITFFELNEHTQEYEIIDYLKDIEKGKNIGLMSESGVPCLADPGSLIVKMAHQKNIEVIPLVGPSSVLLALIASGFNGQNFTFHGYLPIDKIKRANKIKEIERNAYQYNQTQIFIEAPYRNNQLLENILSVCKSDTLLCIAVEISGENSFIKTKSISDWKRNPPDCNKKNVVFLLYK